MVRFPFNDFLVFSLMLAAARWGDALPLALLRIAQWALGLELIGALVVCAGATAVLRLAERRGVVVGFVLAVCALAMIAFFGIMLAFDFDVAVLLLFALMLVAPITLATWRGDIGAVRSLRTRSLVVLGVMFGMLLEPAAFSLALDPPLSPETRVALGYHAEDRLAMHANVSLGLVFYGALSVVEVLRWAWWRLTRNWE